MSRFNPRSRARSWALQLLYAWEVSGSAEPLAGFAEKSLVQRRVSDRYRDYAFRLLRGLSDEVPAVDRRIQEHLSNWRLERLTAIDRGILRLATFELAHVEDVPRNVAIHEAIRLAERYGTDDSPRFVNGVLDAIARGLPERD